MYIITDWANNAIFGPKTFETFDDAWEYIYIQFPDEEDLGEFCVKEYSEFKKYDHKIFW